MVNDLNTNLTKITRKSTTLTRKSLRSNKYTKRGHLREKCWFNNPQEDTHALFIIGVVVFIATKHMLISGRDLEY